VPERDPVAGLRHDLRTPLAVVAGFAELLGTDRPLGDEDRRDYAERIANAVGDMRALLDATQRRP
jgi:signal transduction histidine kinase